MESRFEEMTKKQLLAELAVATEKNKYLRDRVDQFEQEEKSANSIGAWRRRLTF